MPAIFIKASKRINKGDFYFVRINNLANFFIVNEPNSLDSYFSKFANNYGHFSFTGS